MSGPTPAMAAARSAVRAALTRHDLLGQRVLVACSGGADSLALAVAAQFVAPRHGGTVCAAIIDHRLQPGSDQAALAAASHCTALGLDPVQTISVNVPTTAGGVEDAARTARYAALAQAAQSLGAAAVLVGHTLNDQAEQVLLGLARGSGARSLAGMPSARPLRGEQVLLVRPFLALGRDVTEQVCVEVDLTVWRDPHNADARFSRVRARSVLGVMEADLGPGVAQALARSADLLRVDADTLDHLSDAAYTDMGPMPWPVEALAAHPAGIRTRLLRSMVIAGGADAGSLSSVHLGSLDDLVVRWHGQGPVDLPGPLCAHREDGRIWLRSSIPS